MRFSSKLVAACLVAALLVLGILLAIRSISRFEPQPSIEPIAPEAREPSDTPESGLATPAADAAHFETSATRSATAVKPKKIWDRTTPWIREERPSPKARLEVLVHGPDPKELIDGAFVLVTDSLNGTEGEEHGKPMPVDMGPLTAGTYWLWVMAPHYFAHREPLVLPDEPTTTRVDVGLEPCPRIKVRWVAPDGSPIAEAFAREHDQPRFLCFRATATYAQLVPETILWGEKCQAELSRCYTLRVDDSTGLRHPVEVSDDGKPLAIDVAEDPAAKGELGTLELSLSPPLWITAWFGDSVIESKRIEPGTNEVVFTTDVAMLKPTVSQILACVVDADSDRSIEGAHVEVCEVETGSVRELSEIYLRPGSKEIDGYTGQDGCVQPISCTAGRKTVNISARGRETRTFELYAGRTSPTDMGKVRLQLACSICFHVQFEGKPAAGARIVLVPSGRECSRACEHEVIAGIADDAGRVCFKELGRGRYRLIPLGYFSSSSLLNMFPPPMLVDATNDQPKNIDIELEASPLVVGIDFGKLPPPGTRLQVETMSGVRIEVQTIPPWGTLQFSLAPGSYSLRLLGDDVNTVLRSFDVADKSFRLLIAH